MPCYSQSMSSDVFILCYFLTSLEFFDLLTRAFARNYLKQTCPDLEHMALRLLGKGKLNDAQYILLIVVFLDELKNMKC